MRTEAARRHRRARRAVVAAAAAALLTSTLSGSALATPGRPDPSAASEGATRAAVASPPTQTPGADPDFVDIPLDTNPISPSLVDVTVRSNELGAVDDALDLAQDRRDDALTQRDRLRDRIEELAEERAATVEALADRVADVDQRGRERRARVGALGQRVQEVEEAQGVVDEAERALERARDRLRELVIANYISESSTISDIGTVLSAKAGVNDALVRLSLGESSVGARARDIDDRTQERDAAVAARTRAEEARARAAQDLDRAEQAERDAVAAREETEQHIRDIDAAAESTRADEVAAVETVGRREGAVLEATAEITPARLRGAVVGDGLDFQLVALDAWVKAAAGAPCGVEWWMLAGISKIEGNHGTYGGGRLGARGYPTTRIIGPPLDGTSGNALIRDTDGGLYDDDPTLDRAVGPMQFIPSTWARWGRDGDGDTFTDPHTFYDATAGAAAYLCAGRTDLTDEAQLRAAYFSYNHSQFYVAAVLKEARAYQAALVLPPPLVDDPALAGP